MIHELRISGLGVIAEATCRFAPGFTAVTGETGAGKTMVVSGLGLLGGTRADSGLVRSGSAQAAVEGWFDAPGPELIDVVVEAGGIVDDDGLTAARLISSRSRAVLAGRGVPTALLAEVVGRLLVIHGQHDQTRISGRALSLLDAFAGPETADLAGRVATLHAELRAVERELVDLRASEQERARELDVLSFSLAEIADVEPVPDEDIALAAEADRLANAEDLVAAARTAQTAITAHDEGMDAMGLLDQARRALAAASAHDPQLAAYEVAIRSVMAQVGELAADLSHYGHEVDADPLRLAAIQDRQALLARLTRKYGPTVADVLRWSDSASARLAEVAGADERVAELEDHAEALRVRAASLCAQLSRSRHEAADRFADAVARELAALSMPRARVAFSLTTTPDQRGLVLPDGGAASSPGPVSFKATGVDDVSLMLAANPGAPLRPLAQAASGGELSRVMLAVQVVLAGADPVPTMVFDEVDAGVGGAAAIEVGRRLQALSERTQVIVVTHLAQVAAFADHHLVVTKDSDGAITESSIREVAGGQRVRELSRMLAGLAESEAAGAHAAELLDLAHRAPRPKLAGAAPAAR